MHKQSGRSRHLSQQWDVSVATPLQPKAETVEYLHLIYFQR